MRYVYTMFAVAGWGWLMVVGVYLAVRLRGLRGGAAGFDVVAKPQARRDADRVDVTVRGQEGEGRA